ncbi:MAG: aminotransferase class V-fold PLP-dependent enzyme [Hamadaea sp.]|uniref:aminotransferase class V-fold PLP-dependent enzyme n=1 Tax=Hamadaea sp. TaxID=2024425 RepID=UPI0017AB320D|nr:aminotransferase class V-fold PLP-dependent enzyme [Hamadaea sp.]NUR73635.1 aminotransferase class V-fold PLP-dependent enzyme [Hamadaea sp.]NUT20350.1 aminotransferase class V-fold PLP-dependent enzyme [Hamadaea sp.]
MTAVLDAPCQVADLTSVTEPAVLGVPGQINLDYAATAPCARAASDAVNEILPWYASVHRGAGALSQRCTLAYERARQTVGDFVGAREDDYVIFTRNTTDALNLLAHVIPADTLVVTFAGEHHANLLPWRDCLRLPVPGSPGAAVRSLDSALRVLRQGADERPLLVSVTGATNVTGELWPIRELSLVARRHGARVAVDAAQLAPHHPVDLADLGADYLALSGHKLYAPFGAGVLVGRSDWLDAATPYLAGGGASAKVGDATHDVRWATGPARHEAGTPNLLGAVALAAVCSALEGSDRAALAAREQALLHRLRTGLAALDGVAELRIFAEDAPRVGIVSFAVAGRESAEIAAGLARRGIGVRDGLFCAHPLARRLLGEASQRAGWTQTPATALRASIGLGTTGSDVDAFLTALTAVVAAAPSTTPTTSACTP